MQYILSNFFYAGSKFYNFYVLCLKFMCAFKNFCFIHMSPLPACMPTAYKGTVYTEVRRGLCISRNWLYRWV